MRVPDDLSWSRPSQALLLVVRGATARTCGPVALLVGTVLTAVNQGGALLHSRAGATDAARAAANFAIPYCVSSYGLLAHRRAKTEER